jgi:hypothetical protein
MGVNMSRKFLWISLLGGGLLVPFGIKKLYQDGDWGLLILSVLIIAFSTSGMAKKSSDDASNPEKPHGS